MSTYQTDNPIPPEVAKRLLLAYMVNPRGPLAALYWTGSTPSIARNCLKQIRDEMAESIEAQVKDHYAFEADFRALYGYFEEHQGRGYTREWDFIRGYGEVADQVIPWSYRSGWEPEETTWRDHQYRGG